MRSGFIPSPHRHLPPTEQACRPERTTGNTDDGAGAGDGCCDSGEQSEQQVDPPYPPAGEHGHVVRRRGRRRRRQRLREAPCWWTGYQDQVLPTGFTAGTPEEALDCAASLYLDNP